MIATSRPPLPPASRSSVPPQWRTTLRAVHTRQIELADAPALLAIYNPEIIETTVTFDLVPWTLNDARRWISDHEGAHVALVAVGGPDDDGPRGARDEVILGYAGIGPYRARAA